ncbi:methyltransferase domain-containing protein [Streptomyces sp. KM273126]|uniref:methyltransferase domain-containing protein n=1 Tax=Streptomyces sp. KM273126 TaxID=2545247 RepID=UPI0010406CC6|nr:methyltransferase domain-containing protein [Streptomyces sp. KM273126]MBA2807331.1 methyltransferase domain-containing protein [Streptomyces sp. KM273126]
MSSQHTIVPVPEEVGLLYDRLTAMDTEEVGGSLHLGYWESEDSDTPLTEAADLLTDMMADRLRLTAGARVIDVGCGLGQPAMRIAQRAGVHVTGVSISRDQIARATKLAEVHGLSDRVEFQHADAMRLPFADNSFDAALAIESIFHMPDREQVFREIQRVLRPGGRLVLTDFFERAPIPADKKTAVDRCLRDFIMTLADPDDYLPMLRRAGLRCVEFLDITEQSVRPTFERMAQAGNEDLDPIFEEETDKKFSPADMVDVDEFGSLLLTARKPA